MRKTWLWTLIGMIGLAVISYALFLWLLQRRYATGEISTEEYEERKAKLVHDAKLIE